MKGGLIICIISAIILACECQGNFDTIAFVQRWPQCKNKTLCPLKGWNDERFLTHAIVPFTKGTGEISEDCTSVYFDFDPLVEVMDELEFAWPDWPKDEDETVWEKDWRLHGSCTYGKVDGLSNEGDYFKKAIEWYNKYDFTGKLIKKYIFPGMPVAAEMLREALRSNTGEHGQPSINCKTSEGYQGQTLSEIAVCFDASSMRPTGCGRLFGGNMGSCPNQGMIWWPNPIPQYVNSPFKKLFLFNNVGSEDDTQEQVLVIGGTMAVILMGAMILIVSILITFYVTKKYYQKRAAYARFH